MNIASVLEVIKVAVALAPEAEILFKEIEKLIADARAKFAAEKAAQ
jgi:hypothetical protein